MTNEPEYLHLRISEVELSRIGIGLDASRSLRGVTICGGPELHGAFPEVTRQSRHRHHGAGWMKEAGFRETRVEPLVGPDSMVIGIK